LDRANQHEPTEKESIAMPTNEIVTQHTPGPWALHIDGLAVFGAGPDRQQVIDADVCSPNLSQEERKANARLIASAPRMLAKLKDIHYHMACTCRLEPLVDGPVPCETCQLGAVIAQAEGRS
jgi:hypothetical protein